MPYLGPLRHLVRALAKTFIDQDRVIVGKQEEGLRYDPVLILLEDGDTQPSGTIRSSRST